MFLSVLNDKEKKLFLDAAIAVAMQDGVYSSEEKANIQLYCNEMNIPFPAGDSRCDKPSLLKNLQGSVSPQAQKIFLVELTALANADGSYDASEMQLLREICEVFGLDNEAFSTSNDLITQYRTVVTGMANFINA